MLKHYAILYAATLLMMIVFDMLWLKGVATHFYKERLGDLLEFRAAPAIIFYAMYVIGVLVFVSGKGESWKDVLLMGAFFGFIAFATYDLTNLATLRVWTAPLAAVDITWGIFNTGVSATAGWLVARYFAA